MSDVTDAVLAEAADLVGGTRKSDYGTAHENFGRIAALWNAYLDGLDGRPLAAHDIAVLNVLQKVSRLQETPGHRDSWTDMAGYAALGVEVTAGRRTVVVEGECDPDQLLRLEQLIESALAAEAERA